MDVRSRGFPTLVQMVMLLCLLLLAVVHAELEYADSAQAALAGPAVAEGRAKRSSIVFRPLFATRERQAERVDRQDAWRRYWDSERHRQQGQQYSGRKGYQGYQGHQGYQG